MANIFNESIQGVRLLIDVIKIAKKEIRELVEISKKVTKEMKFETSQDFKNLDKEINQVTQSTQELLAIEKQETQLKKELVSLEKAQSQALKAKNSATIQASKEQERQVKIAKRLKSENDKLNSSFLKATKRLNDMRKRYKDLVFSGRGAEKATKQLRREIQKLDSQVKRTEADVGQFQRSVGDYKQALTGSLGAVGQFTTGAGAIAGGVLLAGKAISSAIEIVTEFEQSLKNLGSITGLTGEPLEALGDKAVQLSLKFGTSASEILKGFQLVGSASPQLLEDAEALAAVTEQAEILAKAGGLDLPTAAAALTKSMNQFGVSAEEAASFTDILATSQQKGTATIEQLSESMKNVGSVAKASGFSFEQTNAALQGLAKGGLVGAEAGTKLRGILLKLAKTGRDDLNPATQDFNDILDVLKSEVTDVTKAAKLFGEENAAAALTLIDQKDTVKALNGALDEQGNALKQAENNTDTLNGSVDKLNTSWEALVLSIENGSGVMSDISKVIVDDLSKGLQIISGQSKEAKKEFSLLGLILTSIKQAFTVLVGVFKLLTIPWRIIIDLAQKLAKRFGLVSDSVGIMTKGLRFMVQVLNNLPEITNIVVNSIVKSFSRVSNVIIGVGLIFKGLFSNIKAGFIAASKIVVAYGKLVGTAIQAGITGNIQGVKDAFNDFGKTVGKEFLKLAKNKDIKKGSKLIAEAFTNGLGDFEEAKELIKAIFEDAEAAAKKQGKKVEDDITKDIIDDTEKLIGLIEEQTKVVKKLQDQKLKAESEEEIKRLSAEIEKEQKELDRLIKLGQTAKAKKDGSAEAEFNLAVFRKEQAIKEEKELEARIQNEIALVNFKAEELLKNEKLLEDEKTLIIEKAIAERNAIAKRGDEERAEARRKVEAAELEERKKLGQKINEVINEIALFQKEKFDENQQRLDDEIAASEKQQDRLQDLADRGSETAQENLASEQKREKELRLQKQREQEKQKQTELLFKGLDVFSANLAQGQSAGQAAANTVTTITLLGQALRGIPFFKDGTEDTGTVSNPLDSDGGRLAVIHDNERYIPKVINAKMKGISNDSLGNLAESYKRGELVRAEQNKISELSGAYLNNAQMMQQLDKIDKTLSDGFQNMPKSELNVDLIKQVLTLRESRGGKITNNHIRINNRRSWG